MNTRHTQVDTMIGSITIVATNNAISRLYFRHHVRPSEQGGVGPKVSVEDDTLLARAATQLHEYLMGIRREFELPLDPSGDAFQRAVWDVVRQIPFGETMTHRAIAERLGKKTLSFRVGRAVGANPLRIFVPCHRVLGPSGEFMGYAGGSERKRILLELEVRTQGKDCRVQPLVHLTTEWTSPHAMG